MEVRPTPPSETRSERNPRFDNLKLVLILLVVFGHALELAWGGRPLLRAVWQWIYLFHMPLFAFVSGYFTRGELDSNRIFSAFCRLIVPYFFFMFLYRLFLFLMHGHSTLTLDLFHSYDLMWFLPALFFWRMSATIFRKVRYPLLLSVMLGLLIGFNPFISGRMGWTQTFAFSPFFVLGLLAQNKKLHPLFERKARVASLVVLAGLFALMLAYGSEFDTKWFRHAMYRDIGVHHWSDTWPRLAVYAGSFVAGTAFLSLVPSREFRWSAWGKVTIFPYLLHYFVLKTIYFTGWHKNLPSDTPQIGWLLFFFVLSLGLVAFFSQRIPVRLFNPIVQPPPAFVKRYGVFLLLGGWIFVVAFNEILPILQ